MKYCSKDKNSLGRIKGLGDEFKSRRMRLLEKEFERSPEFSILSRQEQILYKRLKMTLPQEYLMLLTDYSDILTETEALRQCFFYMGGFKDAVFIHNFSNHKYIRH